MNPIETDRLLIRHLSAGDKHFILELLNGPSFLANIGDRKVRTATDAHLYILNGPIASYEKFGFGLYLVVLKDQDLPIGICGLLKRDSLENVDIGFAFLERFWARGFAYESALAVLAYGRSVLGLSRIVAITKPGNHGSIRTLEKIGMTPEGTVMLPGSEVASKLFAIEFAADK